MARELQNPSELHPAPGFSHVAIAEGTRVVHFAGQLGLNADFSLAADDLHGQTVKAMRNVEVAMRAAGVGWDARSAPPAGRRTSWISGTSARSRRDS
jgi:enamine deaminase RidA (YjgF/YER057c/UK114 family)